jgi:hypothetical protein
VQLGDANAQFFAHYHLWKAHRSMGDNDRAALEFNAAGYFVRFVDEVTAEVDEVKRQSGRARG